MDFRGFVHQSLGGVEQLQILSEFKRNDPQRYQDYHARYDRTWRYFIAHRRPSEQLTEENFSRWEREAFQMEQLSPHRADGSLSVISRYERLSNTEKMDIRDHATLNGRSRTDGRVVLEESDFDWLASPDYAEIKAMRLEAQRRAADEAQRTV